MGLRHVGMVLADSSIWGLGFRTACLEWWVQRKELSKSRVLLSVPVRIGASAGKVPNLF